jgi:UDP-glucose:glycoprotein glucosyltransferase
MQGYGVRLDLKNMEYKAIDDSAVSGDSSHEEIEVEMKEDVNADVHGFLFHTLMLRKPELVSNLALFRESLQHLDISPGIFEFASLCLFFFLAQC